MEFKLFYEITLILILAGLIAMLISMLKQPSVIAYILTGLIVGPFGYYQLHQSGIFYALGQIGIALLLFMVGLEIDFKRIRQLGKVSLYTGLGQIIFTAIIGFVISKLFGFTNIVSLYLALAVTFSSTIIVVKLLTDKKDLHSLYGRIVVGVLIVQDLAALGILLLLGGSAANQVDIFRTLPSWQYLLAVLVKVLIITLSLLWLSKRVFPHFLNRLGKSDELLLMFSIAWALGLAAFMSLPFVGFSLEIGGFLAGLALANSQVHYEISARIRTLRDFFLVIFFIVFGTKLVFSGAIALIVPAIVLSLFILIGKPLIVMVIMSALGYKPRTSFFASATIAQISEFSFVLVALGNRMGHVSDQIMGLVTLVGLITIAGSSYMILYSHELYELMKKPLSRFDWQNGSGELGFDEPVLKNHIVLVGAHRLGSHLIEVLKRTGEDFVIVDFDPHIADQYSKANFKVICGDITDHYIQDQVNLSSAKLIISTIPDFKSNLILLGITKNLTACQKKKPKLIFTAQDAAETLRLYGKNVDYVISPHFIGGVHLAKILEDDKTFKSLKDLRKQHLDVLG